MRFTGLAAAASAFGVVSGFWRMECRGRVGLGRIDPLMSPGKVAEHVHTIHGSSGFSEVTTFEDAINGDCTSCAVTQDKSVYWTPALYFKHANGSYELVSQTGGMLAYYFLNNNLGEKLTAFPNGFRMIAGDSSRRNFSIGNQDFTKPDPAKSLWALLGQVSQKDLAQRAVGFNCLDYSKAPEPSLFRHYLPPKEYLDQNCKDGVRIELMFPSCWNGKDMDSPDHKSHVAYPDLVMEGTCPPGFPHKTPGLFYETIWETDAFANTPGEFVIANGDTKGFGYHGDFITGWEQNFLQQAVDTCTNESGEITDCPIFHIQDQPTQNKCHMKAPRALVNEKVDGIVGAVLPGNVAIQYGPQPAGGSPPPPESTPLQVPTVGSSAPASSSSSSSTSTSTSSSIQLTLPHILPTPNNAALTPEPDTPSSPSPTETPTPTDDGLPAVSTQYVTNGNMVSEIIWKQATVYATAVKETTTTVGAAPTVVKKSVRHGRHIHPVRAH